MLLHCMYKRKVIAILGVQVLNSEVHECKKHEIQSNTIITMQKSCTKEQKATVKTVIGDFRVLL